MLDTASIEYLKLPTPVSESSCLKSKHDGRPSPGFIRFTPLPSVRLVSFGMGMNTSADTVLAARRMPHNIEVIGRNDMGSYPLIANQNGKLLVKLLPEM
jgi:hypothetical protein